MRNPFVERMQQRIHAIGKSLFAAPWIMSYRKYVRGVVLPEGVYNSGDIAYWRNEIFCNILTYIAPVSIIALVPGIYMAFLTGIPVVGMCDLAAFFLVIFVMVKRSISIRSRKAIFIFVIYLLSVVLLYYVKMAAPGMLLLLALTIITSIIHSYHAAYYSAWTNTLVCFVFGVFIYLKLDMPFVGDYTVGVWIALSTNLILFGFVCAYSLNLLLRGLEVSITEQRIMEATQLKKLERLVEERTHELNEALEEEKVLVEMKNKFVAVASHEFRTPLSTISFAAETIRTYFHQLSPLEIQRKLTKIQDLAGQMTNLLDDILIIGKSEAGKMNVKHVRIDLKEFVEGLIEGVRATVKEKRRIQFTFSCVNRGVNSDETLLRNVISNLLTNALKFSGSDSLVTITVSDVGDDIVIAVTDEGIGIEPSELASIFESFHRGSNASAIQGTGLGLTILKKAVDLMEGSIEVDSVLNQGSTFRICLPSHRGPTVGLIPAYAAGLYPG